MNQSGQERSRGFSGPASCPCAYPLSTTVGQARWVELQESHSLFRTTGGLFAVKASRKPLLLLWDALYHEEESFLAVSRYSLIHLIVHSSCLLM